MTQRLSHALAAEFIGTFALVFVGAGAAALGAGLVGVALAHGLTVMAFFYAFGHLSGSHLNPAVTVGVWAAGRTNGRRALSYMLGGPVGRLGAGALARGFAVGDATVAVSPAGGWFLEALLAFFLVNAVLHCAVANRAGNLAGVAIGVTYTLDILMGGPLTGAIFNPARQLGPALAAGQFDHLALYLIAPLVGGVVAAGLFRLLPEK
jgi:glycerol uptake facilitator-like aquaporin